MTSHPLAGAVLAGSRPFFATMGGWVTFLTLVVTASAVALGGWRMFRKVSRIAETPDKLDAVIQRLDTIAGQNRDMIADHERDYHRGHRR